VGAERGLAGAEPALAPEGAAPLVALRGVRKAFGSGTVAVERLNLDVRDGEFLSLLGPSGCGKSTVLRLIAGLTSKTDGSIQWRGGQPSLGFVFQEPTLAPWSDVFTNVWLPLRLRGMSRADAKARIEEALARVDLTGFEKAFPRELSGGMKMRVSIARALATNPRLLLMDEPFAALDEISRDHLNEELLRFRAEQDWTAVFVTHSVAEAVFLSTRIVVLAPDPGRIRAVVPVGLPARRSSVLRATPEFETLVAQVSRALQETGA
jgi:NitT/TauT family transport system ATP-binding protein